MFRAPSCTGEVCPTKGKRKSIAMQLIIITFLALDSIVFNEKRGYLNP